MRRSIYSYYEENFGVDFYERPDNTSILVFTTFSNEVDGETFTEQYCYASLCPYLWSAGSQKTWPPLSFVSWQFRLFKLRFSQECDIRSVAKWVKYCPSLSYTVLALAAYTSAVPRLKPDLWYLLFLYPWSSWGSCRFSASELAGIEEICMIWLATVLNKVNNK